MTALIAWGSLSIGIVIGAMWKALCEKQSRTDTNIFDGSVNWHRPDLKPQDWKAEHSRVTQTRSA